MVLKLVHELHYGGVVAGIDEAGRGPWAGPVVAAAVVLNRNAIPDKINDSKKLNKAVRESLYPLIMESAEVGVGICSVEEIDEHNILGATLIAMRRAYDALPCRPHVVLVDGNKLPDLPCTMKAMIGGDAECVSIAAASIIAKVTRDNIMMDLAREFPYYGWDSNAGYGTKSHQDGIASFGVCQHHRRSFAPIKKALMSKREEVA